MRNLRSLPNIGEKVAAELETAGVADAESLARLGSVGAALLLRAAGVSVCANKLFALEGALRGIRWHAIPREERSALLGRLASFADAGSS